jgi:alkylation response protein AidB-like acyl-CoA dehydrogenase
MHIADMLMDVYAADSAVLRAVAASHTKAARPSLHVDAARVFVSDAAMRIEASGRQALAAMVDGDTLRTMLAAMRRLFKMMPVNTAALRRRIADETVAQGKYPL